MVSTRVPHSATTSSNADACTPWFRSTPSTTCKGNSNSHGARPVQLIISMIKWIRTSKLSIKNSLFLLQAERMVGLVRGVWSLGFGVWDLRGCGLGETRKVDVRLPGKRNSNSHGARPVHLIITMIKWIRTSRLSTKNSFSGLGLPASSQGLGSGTWVSVWGFEG